MSICEADSKDNARSIINMDSCARWRQIVSFCVNLPSMNEGNDTKIFFFPTINDGIPSMAGIIAEIRIAGLATHAARIRQKNQEGSR
jgi:hypothetical protein